MYPIRNKGFSAIPLSLHWCNVSYLLPRSSQFPGRVTSNGFQQQDIQYEHSLSRVITPIGTLSNYNNIHNPQNSQKRTFFSQTIKKMGVERKVLSAGSGAKPNRGDKITVHCTGYVERSPTDRTKFWSTLDTNEPFSFNVGLGQVIRGWDEGMLQMSIGEESELTMTSDYGYGDKGFPAWNIPGGATLTFVIKMLNIN